MLCIKIDGCLQPRRLSIVVQVDVHTSAQPRIMRLCVSECTTALLQQHNLTMCT